MECHKQIGDELLEWNADETDCPEIDWSDLISNLNDILLKKNPDKRWSCSCPAFGWRRIAIYGDIIADNAKEFLRKVLPNTDCTFKIYDWEKGIAINNYHHDSPTGEWYYCKPFSG